jgi:hypothetical protein
MHTCAFHPPDDVLQNPNAKTQINTKAQMSKPFLFGF